MIMHLGITTNVKLLKNFLNVSSQFLYCLIMAQE